MRAIYQALRAFLQNRFTLHEDRATNEAIISSVKKGVDFRGTNLWALVFAILIASIGLNVNSTAVIIGAMLISPLMGPITGLGLAIGINDFALLKRCIQNLGIAAGISILTSTIYFSITPLHEAQSELLARTTPSIWDVFIAFFGGLAGMVAGTRKEKSNVIPGVAIATALMPPLCTAGYGLATGHYYYFLGALYLFFINSVFICIASYLVVRGMRLPRLRFEDPARGRRVRQYMFAVVVLTLLPSIYMAWRIVDRSIFENRAAQYVQQEWKLDNTQVVKQSYHYTTKQKMIDLLLIGEELSPRQIDSMRARLAKYSLKDVKLRIRQGVTARQEIDITQIKASILEDVMARGGNGLVTHRRDSMPSLRAELAALFPNLQYYSLSPVALQRADTTLADSVMLFYASFSTRPTSKQTDALQRWLQARTGADSLLVVLE